MVEQIKQPQTQSTDQSEEFDEKTFEEFCQIDIKNSNYSQIATAFFENGLNFSSSGSDENDYLTLYGLINQNEDKNIPPTKEVLCEEMFQLAFNVKDLQRKVFTREEIVDFIKQYKQSNPKEMTLQEKISHALIRMLPSKNRSEIYKSYEKESEIHTALSTFIKNQKIVILEANLSNTSIHSLV